MRPQRDMTLHIVNADISHNINNKHQAATSPQKQTVCSSRMHLQSSTFNKNSRQILAFFVDLRPETGKLN